MDLTPLPSKEVTCLDDEAKDEVVKKLHQKAKENLEKMTAQYKAQADKKRKAMVYKPGDWVWLHMRPERFPRQRKSKLDPRGDGPFRVLEKINDNAYKLELPGEVRISTTFNVSDLSPFSVDEGNSDEEPLQEGENDEDIETATLTPIKVPAMYEPPKTRQGYKKLRKEFDQAITSLLSLMDHSPMEHEENVPNLKTMDLEAFGPIFNNGLIQEGGSSSPSPSWTKEATSRAKGEAKLVLTIASKEPPLQP